MISHLLFIVFVNSLIMVISDVGFYSPSKAKVVSFICVYIEGDGCHF